MKKGFTLMELLVVVIIVGILAAIGLPQFFKVAEKGRAAEGVTALGAMRNAQLRFAATDASALTTDDRTKLDVSFTGFQHFDNPVAIGDVDPATDSDGDGEVDNALEDIASMARVEDGSTLYTLYIQVDGSITCTAGERSCADINIEEK